MSSPVANVLLLLVLTDRQTAALVRLDSTCFQCSSVPFHSFQCVAMPAGYAEIIKSRLGLPVSAGVLDTPTLLIVLEELDNLSADRYSSSHVVVRPIFVNE